MEGELFEKLEKFFEQYRFYTYKRHEVILHAYDIPSGLYYIKKGFVRLYSISKDGEELTRIILGPNDFFPIRWTITSELPDYYVEAMTNVEAWRAPKEKVLEFLKEHPDVLIALTDKILVRMGGLYKRMEYLAFGNAYAKVTSILSIFASRFGEKEETSTIISVPFTHKDIASLVGLTRETISIEMEKLEKKGIIAHKNHFIIIKDIKALNKESLLENVS